MSLIQPEFRDDNTLMQISEEFVIDKKALVTVPHGYKAYAIVDEKPIIRLEPGSEQRILESSKSFKNKHCKIAFIYEDADYAMNWGFGNIHVNNERLKEAYRIGANGTYTIKIKDPIKVSKVFKGKAVITSADLREKSIELVKNIGTSVLGTYFANTNISVFEISGQLMEIRNKLLDALKKESAFEHMGVTLEDLVVSGIHVNEDDINLIRERINEIKIIEE